MLVQGNIFAAGSNDPDFDNGKSNDETIGFNSDTPTAGISKRGLAATIIAVFLFMLIAGAAVVRKYARGPKASLMAEICAATKEKVQLTFLSKYSRRLFSNVQNIDEYKSMIAHLEVPRARLQFERRLGAGNYGIVDLATLAKTNDGRALTRVAVKTVIPMDDGSYDAVMNEALLTEALVLFALQHQYVLGLAGVCTEKFPFCLLTEHMINGDLKTFLQTCRQADNALTPLTRLTMLDAIIIVERITRAMSYLESVLVIHRDVAARNVLVGESLIDVKLGDLGASRSIFREAEREYTATSEHTPARWMALEALQSAKFTSKTDVWSFGVFCWEVCSLGQRPYGEIGAKDMVDSLMKGNRLPRSPSTPPGLYKIMLMCWSKDPKRRPRFVRTPFLLLLLLLPFFFFSPHSSSSSLIPVRAPSLHFHRECVSVSPECTPFDMLLLTSCKLILGFRLNVCRLI